MPDLNPRLKKLAEFVNGEPAPNDPAFLPELPEIRDGDVVEGVVNGEAVEGIAIVDGDWLYVETPNGVVRPDQRFPLLLIESAW